MIKESSEIVKLTERIAKDPKSKLFVPLAEEYKKTGDIDMSVHVLTEGLKNNPGYVTARSFLARLLIENGDLAGAQREFEEVVKTIPDNLMAQRKLGDLYALQGRIPDALRHYKTALSLNPKDQEIAKLISEAESGRDIKQYLPKPKTADIDKQKETPEQPKTLDVPADKKAGTGPNSTIMPAKPNKPSPPVAAIEEPEEVLIVEPLDEVAIAPPVPDEEQAANGMDFLAEISSGQPSSESEPETNEKSFSLDEPFAAPVELPEESMQAADDPFALGISNSFEETEDASQEQPEKQADDFTTDTLAELYISQGFFEKAIDIYERMLVDKPDSQGLQDKLSKVREMAAAAEPAETSEAESETLSGAGIIPETEAAGFDADAVVRPVHGSEPRLDDFELPAEETSLPHDDATPQVRLPVPQLHFDVGFEPREYIPPDAILRQKTEEIPASPPAEHEPPQNTEAPAVGQLSPSTRKSAASRKETVDRLENWLKNIMEEK
jgi:tetratricopeptide (TPR) repeat protein